MQNGIPAAFFVEDVAAHMEAKKMDAKALLEECDNLYQQCVCHDARALSLSRVNSERGSERVHRAPNCHLIWSGATTVVLACLPACLHNST